ncbi:hypothetical protein TNCV_2593611 [Trichonephila clavipes]|nr:hypothetical protein TNCV_2593611 [Trichonephila clavipes]
MNTRLMASSTDAQNVDRRRTEGAGSNGQEANYTRAFGDGPRNFEPWSNDVDDTLAGTPSPNYHTTPTGGRFSSRQI